MTTGVQEPPVLLDDLVSTSYARASTSSRRWVALSVPTATASTGGSRKAER
ncbi:hypothetical protein [Streptomyces sp. C10-9-1]|uniref:hypothetical protein n=1 Tax=Streptomyces sp. C10-9-1 TaxID=1859285 RepID=UPI003F49C5FF